MQQGEVYTRTHHDIKQYICLYTNTHLRVRLLEIRRLAHEPQVPQDLGLISGTTTGGVVHRDVTFVIRVEQLLGARLQVLDEL